MTWQPAADHLTQIEQRRELESDQERLRRLAAIRSRARTTQQPIVGIVHAWEPPAPVTWTNRERAEHVLGFYVFPSPHETCWLRWYSVCRCGWHVRVGRRLRTSVEASWEEHVGESRAL